MILEIEGARIACDRLNDENIETLKALKQEMEQPSYHLEIVRAMIRRDTEEVVGLLRRDINTLRDFLQEV